MADETPSLKTLLQQLLLLFIQRKIVGLLVFGLDVGVSTTEHEISIDLGIGGSRAIVWALLGRPRWGSVRVLGLVGTATVHGGSGDDVGGRSSAFRGSDTVGSLGIGKIQFSGSNSLRLTTALLLGRGSGLIIRPLPPPLAPLAN